MRAFVFTDRSLERLAGRFVWLEVNTEREVNAEFVEHFSIEGWPTLFVIDPYSDAVLLRRLGSSTVEQIHEIAAEGERAFAGEQQGWRRVLAQADRLYGAGRNAEAAEAYRKALASAPREWAERGRAVESFLFALSSSGQDGDCAEEARACYPGLRDAPAAINLAAVGLGCALDLDRADARRAPLVAAMRGIAEEVLSNPRVEAAADDRSGVYQILHAALKDAGDDAGALDVARRWAAFLEGAASHVGNAEARAVFDSHRISAYLALGELERALSMLQASERDLPADYNPPARLALVLEKLGRLDEALAASRRALALVYGPRRITVLRVHAEILAERGDTAGAKEALREALGIAAGLPSGRHAARTIDRLKQQLDGLGRMPAGGGRR